MSEKSGTDLDQSWDLIIEPSNPWFDLKIGDILRYKDLLVLFVRRDLVTIYKQTILGPLWIIIQPVLTTIVFTVIFGRVAKIPTDGLPHFLFYLSGLTVWSYFSDCLKATSNVFTKNQNIFGKVYFPRAIIPLSIVASNLVKLGIQLGLFIGFWFYFYGSGVAISIQAEIVFFPVLVFLLASLSLGFGLIASSLTSKYRDLTFLITFGVQLFMYASPVVYPTSLIQGRFKELIWFNPLTAIIESFRYMFLGEGAWRWEFLGYSTLVAIALFTFGLAVFNRTEKNFMDTV